MTAASDGAAPQAVEWVDGLAARVRSATPARIFTGRAGTSYRTAAALQLRADHAAAQDAVHEELDSSDAALRELAGGRDVLALSTLATSKAEYLRRPDLGRRMSEAARVALAALAAGAELQIVLGDGLSPRALREQAPALIGHLHAGAKLRGWTVGGLPLFRYCRVGIMNDIGAVLDPDVVVLLIGERPGLASASSLSAYVGYRPRPGHNDGDRNLVANIHPRGLGHATAAERVLGLAEAMRAARASGVAVKEPSPAALAGRLPGEGARQSAPDASGSAVASSP